jgi:hypothetical protein
LASEDKIKIISRISKLRNANYAHDAVWVLRRYNAKNGIFWQKEIRDAVDKLCADISEVLMLSDIEDRRGLDAPTLKRFYDFVQSFTDSTRPYLVPLRTMIIGRLNADIVTPDKQGEGQQ